VVRVSPSSPAGSRSSICPEPGRARL
jgi:hypothetical protein